MPRRRISAALLLTSLMISACSMSRPAVKAPLVVEPALAAWLAARHRLHLMCPQVPRTEDELTRALSIEQENGCYARFAKDSYAPAMNDWHWHWLPPYEVVAAIHDEELRKRVVPRFYDEYMSGLNRYLAKKADEGEITPGQFRYVFTAGWNWLTGKMRDETILLQKNTHAAEGIDPAMRDRLTSVAGELATVATLAIAVSAPDKSFQPTPANCYAYTADEGMFTIRCY